MMLIREKNELLDVIFTQNKLSYSNCYEFPFFFLLFLMLQINYIISILCKGIG